MPIKIMYGVGESGWAEIQGDRVARIVNIPATESLNWGDLVELERRRDSRFWVKRVLSRKFCRKSSLRYPTPYQEHFDRLRVVLEPYRGRTLAYEGLLDGWLVIAHGPELDVLAICSQAVPGCRLGPGEPMILPAVQSN